MYKKYFGLLDEPFRMTPDTRYLFRSQRHEEAISSLMYGISERKGFIVITGEIGTGKTTLCRALLNQLDPKTKTAIILNPSLSRTELLHAIIDDLGIKVPGENPTQKQLMDTLNEFLIAEAQAGGNVVVIIDEAQNLDTDVLEFIRMLSNLETEQEKLLQIILVGQPELNEILKLDRLEQLRQRIAVRYHITPLEADEILQYIRHRLMVAGGENCVEFLPEAIDAIDEYTRGTPRLINIICDKCLLAAYACDTRVVDEDIARKSITDHEGPSLQAREEMARARGTRGFDNEREVERIARAGSSRRGGGENLSSRNTVAALVVIGVALVALVAARGDKKVAKSSAATPAASLPAAAAPDAPAETIEKITAPVVVEKQTVTALSRILGKWGADESAASIVEAGLSEVRVIADLPTLSRIGLPALIQSAQTELALVGANPTTYTFFDSLRYDPARGADGDGLVRFPRLQFDRVGLVQARIPLPANWAYSTYTKNDPRSAELLGRALARVRPERVWNTADARGMISAEAILAFQSAVGLPADGIVGPMTWCALVARAHPEYPAIAQ